MRPPRLALLIAALLALSTALLVASVRYPDEEFGLTIERANAINEQARAGIGGSYADCFAGAADPERPCAVAHLHNFAARARLLGGATGLAVVLVSLAFRRRYDLAPRREPADA